MTDKQPEALKLADELVEPIENFPNPTALEKQAAALLRTQHAAIERKDALLRQALAVLGASWPDEDYEDRYTEAVLAITKELAE